MALNTSPLTVVAFKLGDRYFAVEAAQVRALLPPQYPSESVASLAGLLGLSSHAHSAWRCLSIKRPDGDCLLKVSEPVFMTDLDSSAIYPLPPLIAAKNTLPAMRGLALCRETAMALLDLNCVDPSGNSDGRPMR